MQWYRDYVTKAQKRSSKWPRFARKLKKLHPYCAACDSKRLLAGHHVKPFHLFPWLELEPDNVIILCWRCHFLIAHLRNWKSWNKDIVLDAKKLLSKIRSRP